MISRLTDLAMSTTFASSLLLASTSCATRHAGDSPSVPARSEASMPDARRLVQFSFGSQAVFGICVEPACPAVTPKILSMTGTVAMQLVSPRALAPAESARESGATTHIASVQSSPSPPTPPAPVRPADPAARKVVIGFPFASTQLTSSARATLSDSIRQARLADRIVVSGRTDIVGNEKVNKSLALARAMAVSNYLRDQAPDLAAVLTVDAKGRCCFVAPNETEDGRSRNRRVEITFYSQGGA
jgi:outer membrane protein OmpA-like peptidoglycan-associated protein